MTTTTALFPPANRTAALVAFLRTFWQTVRAVGGLTVIGGGAIVVTNVTTIDWTIVCYAAIGTIASGIIAGLLSAGDILTNGLPNAYSTAIMSQPGSLSPKRSTMTPAPLESPVQPVQPATVTVIPAIATPAPLEPPVQPVQPVPPMPPMPPVPYTPNPLTGN